MLRRTLVVILIALVTPVVLDASPAAAETTVDPNGNVVTITVKVDVFAGPNARTGPDGTPIDQYFKTVLEDTWGAAFTRLPYKSCFLFELDLDIKLHDINDKGRKGSHKLYVGTETRGWKGVGWDGAPKETSRDGDTGDGTRSFENNRKGDIPANAPPLVVAHEFGHLFGLGDDRKDGAPTPGHDLDDVMVGGVDGVDLSATPDIDQKVVDRIGKLIERYLKDQGKKPLAKCQVWNGTISGAVVAPCGAQIDGSLALGIVGGAVRGQSEITYAYSGDPLCTVTHAFPASPVEGSADEEAFTLDLVDGVPASPLRIEKVSPTEARTEFDFPIGGGVTSHYAIELRCQNCRDEAVG